MLIVNAFSLNMLSLDEATINVRRISLDEARRLAADGLESAVGHPDTAAILTDMLGVEVNPNRVTVKLQKGKIMVAQYIGPRLPEGSVRLPEGARIDFFLVELQ